MPPLPGSFRWFVFQSDCFFLLSLHAGCFGLDIGPQTVAAFRAAIMSCRTLFWNGPMGRFEVPGFAQGTEAVATAMGRATESGATTVIGGEVLVSHLLLWCSLLMQCSQTHTFCSLVIVALRVKRVWLYHVNQLCQSKQTATCM